jgi:glycosyltransferase involved in cell wall biosynthesis
MSNGLLISNDIRSFSGVANVSYDIIGNTFGEVSWTQIGVSLFGFSQKTTIKTPGNDIEIYHTKRYDDIDLIQKVINENSFDFILLFDDIHNFRAIFELDLDIPIYYYHVLDEGPAPINNKVYYDKCAAIFCINKLTEQYVKEISTCPIVKYVPHGVNENFFKPLQTEKSSKFRFLVINRNLYRKRIDLIIEAFKLLSDEVGQDLVELYIHSDKNYEGGFDLENISEDYSNILFSDKPMSKDALVELYNSAHCLVNTSENEGWGLSATEAVMCGIPIIINKTGGLKDQALGDWALVCNDSKENIINFENNLVKVHTPKVSTIRGLMKEVFSNKNLYISKALKGREHLIEDGLTSSNMSNKILELI